MLKGIWPSNEDEELLTQFIMTHFDDCANSYFALIRWLWKMRSTYTRNCDELPESSHRAPRELPESIQFMNKLFQFEILCQIN
jgi:hypothetical protein